MSADHDPIQQFLDATLALGKHMRDVALDNDLGSGSAGRIARDMSVLAAMVQIAVRCQPALLQAAKLVLSIAPPPGAEDPSLWNRARAVLIELDRYAQAKPPTPGRCECADCQADRRGGAASISVLAEGPRHGNA